MAGEGQERGEEESINYCLFQVALGTTLAEGAFQKEKEKKKKPNKPYDTKDEKIHDFGGGNNDMYFVRVLSNPCKLPQPEFLVLLFLKHAGWF